MTETTETPKAVLRRLYPGKRLEDSFQWPIESLDTLESAFNVQEYLQQLIRKDYNDVHHIVELPDNVDDEVWQYEHLRQVCLELSLLVVALESECTKQNCPEMKADGWLYLCAAHPATQSVHCPAIDYIIHTLDGATILLNNSKYFPSRISVPEPSLKHFQSIARRLYRIFAHAYFHHREIYESFENETSLYARFLLLSQTYGLIPSSLVSIPDKEESNANDNEEDNDYNRNIPHNASAILLSQGS
ncbi:Mob1/phocein [Cokeromyces recurvatus]|uniref:Mob1/phocein n=1 Tax=Cokeromyces recurvatus TaxID=90255 RepID=UPI002220C1B4|nr:Mob1/phocein [Cokeromyces recurvatus]KAI7904408.1 Mob1/phocein [Cokeromyces recurvatus]